MGLVALNVLEQVAHLAGHIEVLVVACVVGAIQVVVALLGVTIFLLAAGFVFVRIFAVGLKGKKVGIERYG